MAEAWKEAKAAGNSAYTSGDYPTAIAKYSEALEDADLGNDDRAVILCNRAQAHLKAKTFAEAVEDCTACLSFAPNHVKALFRRGSALEALSKKADAIKDFKEVLRINPAQGDAKSALRRLDPDYAAALASKRTRRPKISKEDMQQLVECETRADDVKRQIQQAGERLHATQYEMKKSELTLSSMAELKEGTKLFEQVGKMFVVRPKEHLDAKFVASAKAAEEKIKVAKKTLEYLGKQHTDAQSSLKELMAAVQAKA